MTLCKRIHRLLVYVLLVLNYILDGKTEQINTYIIVCGFIFVVPNEGDFLFVVIVVRYASEKNN